MTVVLSPETLAALTRDERLMILFEAAASGNEGLLRAVLSCADVDPNAIDPHPANRFGRGTRALHLASSKQGTAHPAAVAVLLAHGADPDAEDDSGSLALHHAAYAPTGTEAVVLLLAAHARAGRTGAALCCVAGLRGFGTPLHHAVLKGPCASVLCLLEAGATPNETGSPPLLHVAVSRAHVDADEEGRALLEILLASGARLTAVDEKGRTAVQWARELGAEDYALMAKFSFISFPCLASTGMCGLARDEGEPTLFPKTDADASARTGACSSRCSHHVSGEPHTNRNSTSLHPARPRPQAP